MLGTYGAKSLCINLDFRDISVFFPVTGDFLSILGNYGDRFEVVRGLKKENISKLFVRFFRNMMKILTFCANMKNIGRCISWTFC